MPRIRYTANGLTRDTSLKIISGKTPYAPNNVQALNVLVYFGSFFTAGCKPIVTATVEPTYGRKVCDIASLNDGGEIDYRGFRAHVWDLDVYNDRPNVMDYAGWVHWTATGY